MGASARLFKRSTLQRLSSFLAGGLPLLASSPAGASEQIFDVITDKVSSLNVALIALGGAISAAAFTYALIQKQLDLAGGQKAVSVIICGLLIAASGAISAFFTGAFGG